MAYDCGKFKTGDKGQRYEVRFINEGDVQVLGWTDEYSTAMNMRKSVDLHPSWHTPVIKDRKD